MTFLKYGQKARRKHPRDTFFIQTAANGGPPDQPPERITRISDHKNQRGALPLALLSGALPSLTPRAGLPDEATGAYPALVASPPPKPDPAAGAFRMIAAKE